MYVSHNHFVNLVKKMTGVATTSSKLAQFIWQKIIPSYFVVPPFLWSSQECEKINDNNREKPFRIKLENGKYAKCLNSKFFDNTDLSTICIHEQQKCCTIIKENSYKLEIGK